VIGSNCCSLQARKFVLCTNNNGASKAGSWHRHAIDRGTGIDERNGCSEKAKSDGKDFAPKNFPQALQIIPGTKVQASTDVKISMVNRDTRDLVLYHGRCNSEA